MHPRWGLDESASAHPAPSLCNMTASELKWLCFFMTAYFMEMWQTKYDIKCTYVTSQLFFRRRLSQPPRAHHISPTHICSFLPLPGSWSRDCFFSLSLSVLFVCLFVCFGEGPAPGKRWQMSQWRGKKSYNVVWACIVCFWRAINTVTPSSKVSDNAVPLKCTDQIFH